MIIFRAMTATSRKWVHAVLVSSVLAGRERRQKSAEIDHVILCRLCNTDHYLPSRADTSDNVQLRHHCPGLQRLHDCVCAFVIGDLSIELFEFVESFEWDFQISRFVHAVIFQSMFCNRGFALIRPEPIVVLH